MQCICNIVPLFLSSFDNNFILIGHSKKCVQSRRTRGVLKIEMCAKVNSGLLWERQAPTHGLMYMLPVKAVLRLNSFLPRLNTHSDELKKLFGS